MKCKECLCKTCTKSKYCLFHQMCRLNKGLTEDIVKECNDHRERIVKY